MKSLIRKFFLEICLWSYIIRLSLVQLLRKSSGKNTNKVLQKTIFLKLRMALAFCVRMVKNNSYIARISHQISNELLLRKTEEVALYGATDVSPILYLALKSTGIRVKGIWGRGKIGGKTAGFQVFPPESLRGFSGPIIIASVLGIRDKTDFLLTLGFKQSQIIRLA